MSVGVLFPGQGSQEPNMGRALAESSSEAMELWLMAEKHSGLPLREIYWDGGDADMAATNALQPALTAVNLSVWFAAKAGISPTCGAGHSLGEYSALAASGALSVEDTLKLVSLRGKLMHQVGGDDGAMAAVLKLNREQVEDIVAKAADSSGAYLTIANYNTPGQHVISGDKAAVDAAAALTKDAKGRAIPLAVSGAFHSTKMTEAAAEFAPQLARADFKAPSFPVVFNITANAEADPAAMGDLMARQLTESVRWTESMERMASMGVTTYLELGPKNVLTKMAGQILPKDSFTATALGHTPESIAAGQAGLENK